MNLDDRDREILEILAGDAWLTYVELGQRVNLSPSAVQRRVEKLKAAGAIQGARAIISDEATDRRLKLFVLVELRDESKKTIDLFRKRLRESDLVMEAHYVAGASDVMIAMKAPDMFAFADFAERNLNDNPSVKGYKTLTSLKPLT